MDVGGRVPGTSACDNTEIYHDGFRIPWLKIHDRGKPNDTLLTLLKANIRIHELTFGDLQAQIASCNIGAKRILEIIERYGLEIFQETLTLLIDQTEKIVNLLLCKIKV